MFKSSENRISLEVKSGASMPSSNRQQSQFSSKNVEQSRSNQENIEQISQQQLSQLQASSSQIFDNDIINNQRLSSSGETIMCQGQGQSWPDIEKLAQHSAKILAQNTEQFLSSKKHSRVTNLSGMPDIKKLSYKNLWQQEINKRQQVQKQLNKYQRKWSYGQQLISKLQQENKMILKLLKKQRKNMQLKNNQMTSIDKKIMNIKQECRISGQKKDIIEKSMIFSKNERKRLQEENEKYKVFIKGLYQSMGMLTQKKIDSMPKLWEQWSKIFQEINEIRNHC